MNFTASIYESGNEQMQVTHLISRYNRICGHFEHSLWIHNSKLCVYMCLLILILLTFLSW